ALGLAHLELVQAHPVVVLGQHPHGDVAARGDIGHGFLHPPAHAGGQRTRGPGQQLRARRLVDRIPFDPIHASILSTGSTISPRAPARLSSSSRCQVTTPWHSACIASRSPPSTGWLVGGSASGSNRSTSATDARGAWNISSLLSRMRSTPSIRRSSICAVSASRGSSSVAVPASTASLCSRSQTGLSWLAASVAPLDTRSQTTSAWPRRGAISTEPLSTTTLASTPCSRSQARVSAGYEVAMRRPCSLEA